MGLNGLALIPDGAGIVHHCNTGALATAGIGTALGVIRTAHEAGKNIHVYVDETRPRLQGARLTAWGLQQYGISYEIISDNAAGYFLRSGIVKRVFFGGRVERRRQLRRRDVPGRAGCHAAHAGWRPAPGR